MKGLFRLLLLAVLFGAAGYYTSIAVATARTAAMVKEADGELRWLRGEFELTDEQFRRVVSLHNEYKPRCDALCEALTGAKASLRDEMQRSGGEVTPAMRASLAAVAAAELKCRQGMIEHVYAVSREMTGENGERYRRMIEAHLLDGEAHQRLLPDTH
jgi:hypothetical protein